MLGRTVRELDATLGSDELSGWIAFERLYGLPDLFFLAGRLGPLLASLFGGSGVGPADVVPYFRAAADAQAEAEFDDDEAIARDAMKDMAMLKGRIENS